MKKMYWKVLASFYIAFGKPLNMIRNNELLISNNHVTLRVIDKDYILIKQAIAKVKDRKQLECMQKMVRDFGNKYGATQYGIYLSVDLYNKTYKILYSNL